MKFYLPFIITLLASPALAENFTIEMLNKDQEGNRMVFSQEVVNVSLGDTVIWVPASRGHNVEMVASPNNLKLKSKYSKEVKITFDKPGIYYYWCSPHKSMGMIGLVVVDDDLSNLTEISKAKAKGKSKKKLNALLKSLG
jgi:pseudoazurin